MPHSDFSIIQIYSDIFTQPRCVWCLMFSSVFLYLKLLILNQDICLTQKLPIAYEVWYLYLYDTFLFRAFKTNGF